MIDPTWAKGIDVSHYKPIQDWDAIPADVVILGAKVTQGDDFTDPTFTAHRDGSRARPGRFDLMPYYHVAEPGDPVAHAQRCASIVGPLAPGECLVVDTERGSRVDLTYVEGVYAEWERLGLATCHDLYYGSAGVWTLMQARGWPRAAQGKVALWGPRYKSGGALPHLPPPWSKVTLFQWTDGGATGDPYSCPGVGACDANVAVKMDRPALQAWVAGQPSP
jgi:hypothetical protein